MILELHPRKVLQRTIIREDAYQSRLATAVGIDRTGMLSVLLYATAIPIAFVRLWMSDACYITAALMWLVPARPIEKRLNSSS